MGGAALLLAGCPDETAIQQKFLGDRGFCQDLAETKMQLYTGMNAADAPEMNAQLIAFYGDCMRSRNWAVGKPPEEKKEDKPEEKKDEKK